jgi:hypothetical protein
MGGERRRRRLRRTGRTPFDAAPEPDSDADSDAGSDAVESAEAVEALGGGAGADASIEEEQPETESDHRPTGTRPPRPGPPPQHRPSPADLADLAGSFALTAGVQDPEPPPPAAATVDQHRDQHQDHRFDDPAGERGLRGLVGGGSSQVNVTAAMRARDASRPTDEDLAAAEAELPIVRRGWVPRDELPRPH